LETTVFLIHPGATNWHRDGLLLGRRDIVMNEQGKAQAERVAGWLADTRIAEVIASPLQRAVQTAAAIGNRFGIDVARDHRFIDFHIGQWEGKPPAEVMASDEYQEFAANPMDTRVPGGETLHEVKKRAVAAVEQVLEDNPSGSTIAIVTHARVIRVLLTHYMGAPPGAYHCLRIYPGTISVLAFSYESHRPRIVAVNWSANLPDILVEPEQPV
jgi:broad specificity phosphatase PhoE